MRMELCGGALRSVGGLLLVGTLTASAVGLAAPREPVPEGLETGRHRLRLRPRVPVGSPPASSEADGRLVEPAEGGRGHATRRLTLTFMTCRFCLVGKTGSRAAAMASDNAWVGVLGPRLRRKSKLAQAFFCNSPAVQSRLDLT